MKKQLWAPSKDWVDRSRMKAFLEFVNRRESKSFTTYRELYDWSVDEIPKFWDAIWDYFEIIGEKPEGAAEASVLKLRESNWFPGAKINYAENMLRYLDTDENKLIFVAEDGSERFYSGKEVIREVLSAARAMQREGVKEGDVVAAYMPNVPEAVIVMLAAAAIGATFCSCASDIGPHAAIDRIGQTDPVILFTADGYTYKGKVFDSLENVKEIAAAIPSVRRIVVSHYGGDTGEVREMPTAIMWEKFIADVDISDFTFPRYPYEKPLVIMFSSGTTGKPKCLVQSAMGLLLNQLKELALHSDMGENDRLLYITSCSWMMWNWQAAALGVGTTLILYGGNPSYPDTGAIWRILEREKVTVFGLSASYIHALIREGFSPKNAVDLSHLREISQTGSALSEAGFDFVYDEIKSDLFFNSIAGGTDINGCFAIASPLQPVYSNELQAAGLGMKIECFDDAGKPVRDTEGELVCLAPAPSMPLYFWNDPDGERYYHAYFDVFDGIWRHGDYVSIDSKTGGITFHGRSDSILKPSGVRIGTAEIYNQVEKLDGIEESLAVGQDFRGDQRVILFVTLKDGVELSDDFVKKIKTTLRLNASPRHVPAMIFAVPEIPHTLNGKKVESAVTNILNGRSVTNRDALSNPDSLTVFEELAKNELKTI